ncbi:hypothetical protein [Nocardia sp. XZ_19_231]|uniref:hypothetical protein n=1 Tax=Nocardia sp. XZ_19_231 TaxID=2769252 RepID=UPI00188E3CC8|nr:hypothetical protein [Nocardia sp. XZ_19_231]
MAQRLSAVVPRSNTQAILDTTYQQRASADDRARFEQIVAEGEAAWRDRHPALGVDRSASLAPAIVPLLDITTTDAEAAALLDQGISDELLTVLNRIQKLSRTVNLDVVDQLHVSTYRSIAQYETLDPAALVAPLKKQHAWLDELIDGCSHPAQRRRLYEIASMTSGLLGYIAVGCAHFSLARAYCQESFQLGDFAQDDNLAAWARGIQSFCEYYAGRFDEALHYAEEGLTRTASGPQGVRLAINGVARASGKLGDVDSVHRAVEAAYELLPGTGTPVGVPSSISLESYSPAQIAGNAATAYLSLARPERVEHFAGLALSEMSDANSPWGRSRVMIDVARSHVLSDDADLDAAVAVMHEALTPTRGRLMLQVQRRGSEFVRDAAARWGTTPEMRSVEDTLASRREER